MRPRSSLISATLLLAVAALLLTACGALGREAPEATPVPITAVMGEISGTVQTLKPENGFYADSFVGENLFVGDQVLTHNDGRARIDFSNETIIRIGPLSNFTLQQFEEQPEGFLGRIFLEVGELWVRLNTGSFEVQTPSGLAAVNGSWLNVWVTQDTKETVITCMEGECLLESDAGVTILLAGQKARLTSLSAVPEDSFMDEEDIAKWLAFNPDIADIIPIMQATQNALLGISPTPLPPELQAGTQTAEAILRATDANCGPPDDWVIYIVQEGDTLPNLASQYNILNSQLQNANCFGASTVLVPGQSIYLPPPPTATVTVTHTPLPTGTNTPPASPTITRTPTASPVLSPTPTRTPGPSIVFTDVIGPMGSQNFCAHDYGATVTDADGIDWVIVEYTLNDPQLQFPSSFDLTASGTFWSKLKSLTMTSSDIVYWRFRAADNLGNEAYFPPVGDDPFEFTTTFACSES